MEHNERWLQWAVELQALAQAGLTYGKDIYDLERYQRIREIAAEMIVQQTDIPQKTVQNLFCAESGYQTPSWIPVQPFFRTKKSFWFVKTTAPGLSPAAGVT